MSYVKEDNLLKTFKSYLLDIKPYHTKLDGIYAEYLFQDRFQVSLLENKPYTHIYLQNVWDSSSFGGWRLTNTIDSSIASRKFRIPQTIIPRFSLNSFTEQFPPGDDPATEEVYGTPIDESPWWTTQAATQGWSYSHARGGVHELPYFPAIAYKKVVNVSNTNVNGVFTFTYDLELYYDTSNLYGANLSSVVLTRNNVVLTGGGVDYTFDQTLGAEKIVLHNLTKVFTLTIPGGTELTMSYDVESQDGTVTITNNLTEFPLARDIISLNDLSSVATLSPSGLNQYELIKRLITPMVKNILAVEDQQTSIAFSESGAYRVPFHHGSYVTVDGVPQMFNEDYIVTSERNVIQFLPGNHPAVDSDIRINYFVVDRLFIALTKPFDVNVSDGYDDRSYDMFDYDLSNPTGQTLNSDYFTLIVNKSLPTQYTLEFFNAISGTSKATIQDVEIYPNAIDGEEWTITAVGPKSMHVVGVNSGEGGIAYFKQRYDNGKIAFTIKNQFLPFYMVPDVSTETSTYGDLDNDLFNVFTFGGTRDTQDYLINLNVVSTLGIDDDFNTQPISYFDEPVILSPFGKITVDKNQAYYFELTDAQPVGSIIEFIVEQNNQYNTWVQVGISEKLMINPWHVDHDYLDILTYGYDLNDYDSQGMDLIFTRDPDGSLANEPFQIATAGMQEALSINIDYQDATPDSIVQEATIYNMRYQQTSAVNELILYRYPYGTGAPGSGPPIFFASTPVLTPVGSANGSMSLPSLNTQEPITPVPPMVIQTWTVTATSPTTFSVSGSVSGLQTNTVTVGSLYNNDDGTIDFTITTGSNPFVIGDVFTFNVTGTFAVTDLDSPDPLTNVVVPDEIFEFFVTDRSPDVVGTGNGVIMVTDIDQSLAVDEVFTLTATSASNFTVTGSVSGAQPAATVGTPYSGIISFLITAGGTAFIAGDEFTVTVKKDWNRIHFRFNVARTFDVWLV